MNLAINFSISGLDEYEAQLQVVKAEIAKLNRIELQINPVLSRIVNDGITSETDIQMQKGQ